MILRHEASICINLVQPDGWKLTLLELAFGIHEDLVGDRKVENDRSSGNEITFHFISVII